jgi:hypothetical protein
MRSQNVKVRGINKDLGNPCLVFKGPAKRDIGILTGPNYVVLAARLELLFGESDRANLRVREDCVGYNALVNADGGVGVEQVVNN